MHSSKNIVAAVLLVVGALTIFSCRRDRDDYTPAPLNPSVEFSLRDTLKMDPRYQSLDPELFARYNGKLYSVNSANKTSIRTFISSPNANIPSNESDLSIVFTDSSVAKLYPSIHIMLLKTRLDNLQAEYDLTDKMKVKIETTQRFTDGSVALDFAETALAGTLRVQYDAARKAISGQVINLRMPLEFYTPEDISMISRSANGLAIRAGGSTRTVQLRFNEIKVD